MIDWPELIAGEAGVDCDAVNAVLTVTFSAGEQRETWENAESLALYE